jgi:LAO/AO transport system kinase
VLINKADGENRLRADQSRLEQDAALHCLQPATPGWKTEVGLCSGLTGEGIPQIWDRIEQFYRELEPKGVIARRRQLQTLDWLADLIHDELRRQFYHDRIVKERLPNLQAALLRGEITAVSAAKELLALHHASKGSPHA